MPELSVKSLAAEDRPREKLFLKGPSVLTEAELLAILIGSGNKRLSAVSIAHNLLRHAGNLQHLARLNIHDLMRQHGIGEVRAATIMAALELGRRKRESAPPAMPQVTSSKAAFDLLYGDLADLPYEEFWILLLNRANRLIRKHKISTGGVAGTVADPKLIYHTALGALASGIIVAHNHPSGTLAASQEDIALTRKLTAAGQMLDIKVIDHLIVAGNRYYSFADHGVL